MITKETFQKSPQKLGSPVRNGAHLISYLSQRIRNTHLDDDPVVGMRNSGTEYKLAEFAEELATVISVQKTERKHISYDVNDNSGAIQQDLTDKFSAVQNSEIAHLKNQVNCILDVTSVGNCATSAVCSSDKDAIFSFPVNEKESTDLDSLARTFSSAVVTAALSEVANKNDENVQKLEKLHNHKFAIGTFLSDENRNLIDPGTVFERDKDFIGSCVEGEIVTTNLIDSTCESLVQEIILVGLAEAADVIEMEQQAKILSQQGLNQIAEAKRSDQNFESFAENLCQDILTCAIPIAAMHCGLHKPGGTLRPLATGNWGCGVFGGDPQLKAVLQWVAASAAGCPAMVYHTFGDKRVEQVSCNVVNYRYV